MYIDIPPRAYRVLAFVLSVAIFVVGVRVVIREVTRPGWVG